MNDPAPKLVLFVDRDEAALRGIMFDLRKDSFGLHDDPTVTIRMTREALDVVRVSRDTPITKLLGLPAALAEPGEDPVTFFRDGQPIYVIRWKV